MISLLKKIFVENWLRKGISLILAIIIWFAVDQSLTSTKTINSVGIRVINIPKDRTISGLQSSGLLTKHISLAVTGKKIVIDELNPSDFEVLIDANQLKDDSVITIDRKHLVSHNPELSVARDINKVSPKRILIKLVPLAEEKIPIYVTKPIGQPPRGYKLLEVWPYHLNLTVRGPEDVIKKLKTRGLKLTFNLNDISKHDLEHIATLLPSKRNVISYFVPNDWKMIQIPSISDKPIQINDPDAHLLRIDFIQAQDIQINTQIPIQVFISPKSKPGYNPSQFTLTGDQIIEQKKGVKVLAKNFYTKGVSELFVNLVKDNLCLLVSLTLDANDTPKVEWSLQVVNPQRIEDQYVAEIMKDYLDDEIKDLKPAMREEYLRNRFRNYMNRLTLYNDAGEKVKLDISIKGKEICINEVDTTLNNL